MDDPEYEFRTPASLPDGGRIAQRARQMVLARLQGGPPQGAPLPDHVAEGLDWVFVTVYFSGALRGCIGSGVRNLDGDLRRLARSALRDPRFEEIPHQADARQVTVTASLLYNSFDLGELLPEQAAQQLEHDHQGLIVRQGYRTGLLLPQVACHSNLDRGEFAQRVVVKAGLNQPPYAWQRFDCSTWMALENQPPEQLVNGFPIRRARPESVPQTARRLTCLLAGYLHGCRLPDGSSLEAYQPIQDRSCAACGPPPPAHARLLARAGQLSNQADRVEFPAAQPPPQSRTQPPVHEAPQSARDLIEQLQKCRRDMQACRGILPRLDQLILQDQDRPLLPNPQRALGGLRASSRRSEILTTDVALALEQLLELA